MLDAQRTTSPVFAIDSPVFTNRLAIAGITTPRTLAGLKLEGRSSSVALMRDAAARYLREEQWREHDLYLWGSTGVGKTHVGDAVLRHLIRRGVWPAYRWTATALLDALMPEEEGRSERIEIVRNAAALMLDEFLCEHTQYSPFRVSLMLQIIDRRYERNVPTIYTANLPLSEIESKIDPRIRRRIADRAINIHVDDQPYRHGRRS